eukprot:TRINITY_DN8284_c0_g2_i3.p1 TRINITY_DN8284_c0_g2~~TRINITY_DN8284_c0_g2_i3.p1  ORF type:complete len:686 (-),score=83.35 TRINITY_DN8284_c0_g2_i3:26-2083(-)
MAPLKDFPPEALGIFLLLGVAVVCLVIYAVMVVRIVALKASCGGLTSAAISMTSKLLQSMRNVFMNCSNSSKKLDAFERKVRELAEEQRITQCKKAATFTVHLSAAFTVSNIFALGFYDLDKFRDAEVARLELHQSTFVLTVLTLSTTLGVWVFSRHVGGFVFDFFNSLIMLRMVWQIVMAPTVDDILARDTVNTTCRVLLAIVIGQPALTCSLNALHAVAKISRYVAILASVRSGAMESCGNSAQTSKMGAEIFILMSTCLVTNLVKTQSLSRERTKLESMRASTSEVTIKALLAVLCDAVVVVTESLLFTAPCMQLAHFLIRQPLSDGYLGCSLLDFMDEEDGETLARQIADAAMGPGTTLSIGTRLVDGAGRRLDVRMYCVAFINWDGSRAYAIGILESKDSHSQTFDRVDSLQAETPNDGIQALHGHSRMHSISEAGGSSLASGSVGAVSIFVPVMAETEAAEVVVDVGMSTIPILHASPGIVHMVGPLVACQSTLGDCVGEVTMWSLAQEILEHEPEENEEVVLGRFAVKPSHALRAGIQYAADVSFKYLVEEGGNDLAIPVRITLQNVSVKTRRRSEARSSTSARRGTARGTSAGSVGDAPGLQKEDTGLEGTSAVEGGADVEAVGVAADAGLGVPGVEARDEDERGGTRHMSGSAAALSALRVDDSGAERSSELLLSL